MSAATGRRLRLPPLRPLQRVLYQDMQRWNHWVCHRRFGKTLVCLCILLKKSFDNPLPAPRYAYLAPLFRQAKQISWDYLKRFSAQIPGAETNEAELRLDLPWHGARIQLLGADNPDSLRGMYLDGVVLDEYAQMLPRTWTQVIRPALSDREGWCIKVGTPYGKNHFYFEWRDAQRLREAGDSAYHTALYKASETGILSEAELASARQTMRSSFGELAGDADYNQEYQCEWEAAIPGAYYANEFAVADAERRIARCPYDPAYPVYTFWDIGIDDATAIWCVQFYGRQVGLIHYHEDSGYGAPHYAQYLTGLPWGQSYRAHFLPHDGGHRAWGTGERGDVTVQRLIQGEVVVAERPSIEVGISNVRLMFPRLLFDEVGCEQGIEALRNYHHKWDDVRKVFLAHPDHSWASHGADALRTMACSLGKVDEIEKRHQGKPKAPAPRAAGLWGGTGAPSKTAWMG
jgi:phage terminase large subunit